MSPPPQLFATPRTAPAGAPTSGRRGFTAAGGRPSASAGGLIVVLTTEVPTGLTSVAAAPATALPEAVTNSTATPAVPCPLGAVFSSEVLMFCSALSEY